MYNIEAICLSDLPCTIKLATSRCRSVNVNNALISTVVCAASGAWFKILIASQETPPLIPSPSGSIRAANATTNPDEIISTLPESRLR